MECQVTYEELAAFAADELDAKQQAEMGKHVSACERCGRRLAALSKADAMLGEMQPVQPEASAILAARRAIVEVTRGVTRTEIMTLGEVGEFLRIKPEELGELVEELPAFELAGQLRVRKAKLIEWIEQRERNYSRDAAASWAARAGSHEIQTSQA